MLAARNVKYLAPVFKSETILVASVCPWPLPDKSPSAYPCTPPVPALHISKAVRCFLRHYGTAEHAFEPCILTGEHFLHSWSGQWNASKPPDAWTCLPLLTDVRLPCSKRFT